MDAYTYNLSDIKRFPETEGALYGNQLAIKPAEFWQQFSQLEISHFCLRRGFYCIPTMELVLWLQQEIGDRSAIEVGAGNGVLADALSIPATDNRMQEKPAIAALYSGMQQAPVAYGNNVKELDALEAVRSLKPEVVIAAWVTHEYRPGEHWRGGNVLGVAEEEIVKRVTYIHVGNRNVHRNKPILGIAHEEFEFPWLVSRSMSDSPNFIAVWRHDAT